MKTVYLFTMPVKPSSVWKCTVIQ